MFGAHWGAEEYKHTALQQARGGQDWRPQSRAGAALEATQNLVLKLCSEALFRKKDGGTVGVQSLMVAFFFPLRFTFSPRDYFILKHS